MEEKVPLSVVIIAKNEEDKIRECLKSVSWAGDIILLDDESEDRTRELAGEYTGRVIKKKMDVEGRHRNYGYSLAKNEWVLSLDADERVSPELKEEIAAAIKSPGEFTGFTIPVKTFIGEHWVRYGGWYPAGKLLLFRKDSFRFEEVGVHPRAFLEGKCGHLKSDIIHRSYRDFRRFLSSLNRQTSLEAEKWYKLSLVNPKKARYKMNLIHTLWRTLDRFIRTFLAKRGYRDGFIGVMVAYFASLYQILSYAKYKEMVESNQKS